MNHSSSYGLNREYLLMVLVAILLILLLLPESPEYATPRPYLEKGALFCGSPEALDSQFALYSVGPDYDLPACQRAQMHIPVDLRQRVGDYQLGMGIDNNVRYWALYNDFRR